MSGRKFYMEMFRFGTYVFIPIGMFYFFNLPEFYDEQVRPNLFRMYPTEGVHTDIPHTREANRALLEKLKMERKAKEVSGSP